MMQTNSETLRLQKYPVAEVTFGAETAYRDGRLTIDLESLRAELLRDPHFGQVDLALVAPHERARIINIVDLAEPRIKPDLKTPDYYPGVGTDPFPIGSGRTNVLSGMAVMATALLEHAEDTVVSCEPGQELPSYFAGCWNLVASPQPVPGVSGEEFARSAARVACRAAVAVARATLGCVPAETLEVPCTNNSPVRPRIGYLCYLYSHGWGRQKFLYGWESAGMPPTVIPITHLLDGALVDNGYTRSVRNSTYDMANNVIAYELLAGHGREHTCAGLVLVPHTAELRYKAWFAQLAARLARDVLGCDGIVISKDGGGQGDVDVMLAIEACEVLGMRTVAAVPEIAGEHGDLYPLVTTVPQADALVSLGSLPSPIAFEPIERVLGGSRFCRSTADPSGPFSIPTGHVPGVLDMMAGTRLSARVS